MGSVGPTDSVHCSTTAAVSLVFFSLLGAVCPLLAVMVLLVTLLLVVLLLVEGGHPPRIALARRAAPLETALGPRRHGLARRAVNFALAHGARARRRSPRSDLRARGAARYWVLLSQNSDSQNSDSFPRAL